MVDGVCVAPLVFTIFRLLEFVFLARRSRLLLMHLGKKFVSLACRKMPTWGIITTTV